MPLPLGFTRGADRVPWLKDAIEAIEDGYVSGAEDIEYPNAGRMVSLKRTDALSRLHELYVQYATATGNAALLKECQRNPRFIRVVGTPGYTGNQFGNGWGYW